MAGEDERQRAKDFALNYLSYRARSCKEVYDRLRRKGYDEEIVEQVVHYLIDLGYLDDRKFAYDWSCSLIDRKIAGRKLIRYELYRKGIPEDIIEETIQRIYDSEDREKELAFQLIRRRIDRYHKKEQEKLRRSLANLLSRHGFSTSVILEVLPRAMDGKGDGPE
ncbi:MAG: regulatory protein RecX [bacterium]